MSNVPSLIALMMAAAGAGAALSPAQTGHDQGIGGILAASSYRTPSPRPAGAFVIEREDDGFFYMTAAINGSAVRLLVDTGASMVILPSHIARKTGIRGTSRAMAMTVGGPQSVELSSVRSFEVAGTALENVPVAIQNAAMPIPLIGMDTLAKIGRIEIDGDQLTVTPASETRRD